MNYAIPKTMAFLALGTGITSCIQHNYPGLMRQEGYQTALIGKIHLEGAPQGFDYSMTLPGQGHYYNPEFIKDGGERIQFEGHSTSPITQFVVDWRQAEKLPGEI